MFHQRPGGAGDQLSADGRDADHVCIAESASFEPLSMSWSSCAPSATGVPIGPPMRRTTPTRIDTRERFFRPTPAGWDRGPVMTTWFTDNLHLGHGNIIGYCSRPFDDVAAMDRALVDRWNEVVQAGACHQIIERI
jgi:hypothetical protein